MDFCFSIFSTEFQRTTISEFIVDRIVRLNSLKHGIALCNKSLKIAKVAQIDLLKKLTVP